MEMLSRSINFLSISTRRLPSWVRSLIPRACYVTEKAWNYYPYTITEYTVRMPRHTCLFIEQL